MSSILGSSPWCYLYIRSPILYITTLLHYYRKNTQWTKLWFAVSPLLNTKNNAHCFFRQYEYFVNIGIISGTPQVDTIIQVWIDKGIVWGQKGMCVKNLSWLYYDSNILRYLWTYVIDVVFTSQVTSNYNAEEFSGLNLFNFATIDENIVSWIQFLVIYNKKSSGPKFEPYGTPHWTLSGLEIVWLNSTYCCLPIK